MSKKLRNRIAWILRQTRKNLQDDVRAGILPPQTARRKGFIYSSAAWVVAGSMHPTKLNTEAKEYLYRLREEQA